MTLCLKRGPANGLHTGKPTCSTWRIRAFGTGGQASLVGRGLHVASILLSFGSSVATIIRQIRRDQKGLGPTVSNTGGRLVPTEF